MVYRLWSVFCIKKGMKNLGLLLILFSLSLQAQKETSRIVDATDLESIIVDSDEVYRITIKASPVKSITIKTKADGEYFRDITLEQEILHHMFYLRSQYRKILQSGFDKLSAHKVFSMEVEMEIPIGMHVEVRSNVASVFLYGTFKDVILELKTGSAFLKSFRGNAVVNTFGGNIEVETGDVDVEANSRNGTMDIPNSGTGSNHLKLTTINGNIKVMETK